MEETETAFVDATALYDAAELRRVAAADALAVFEGEVLQYTTQRDTA